MKKLNYSLRKSKKIGLAPIVLSQFLVLSPYLSEAPQLLNLNRVYADEVVDGVTRVTPNTELDLSADSVKVVDKNGKKYLEISLPDNQIYDGNYIKLNRNGFLDGYFKFNGGKTTIKLENGKNIGDLTYKILGDGDKPQTKELKTKIDQAKSNNKKINANKELILEALQEELFYLTNSEMEVKIIFNENINEGLLDRKVQIEIEDLLDKAKASSYLSGSFGMNVFPSLLWKQNENKQELLSYFKNNLTDSVTPKLSYKGEDVYVGNTKERLFYIKDPILATERKNYKTIITEPKIGIPLRMGQVRDYILPSYESFIEAKADSTPSLINFSDEDSFSNKRIEIKSGELIMTIRLEDGAYKFTKDLNESGYYGNLYLRQENPPSQDGFLQVENEDSIGIENDIISKNKSSKQTPFVYTYDSNTNTMTITNRDDFVINENDKISFSISADKIFDLKNNWVDYVELDKMTNTIRNSENAPLLTGVRASLKTTNPNLKIDEKEKTLNSTAKIDKTSTAYATFRNGEYTVTGKYVDENGEKIQADKLLASGAWNDKFNVKHDDIQGYEYVSANVPTTGVYNAVNRTITFTYRGIDKTEELPFKTIYEEDPNLEEGEQVVTQEGKNGNRVTDNKGKVKSETPPQDKIVKIGVKPKVITEEIPFETKYIEDPNLDEGEEEVRQEGKNGKKTTTTNYVVNKETGEVTEQESKITTENPVDKIIARGTKKKEVPKEETPEIKKLTKYIDDKGNLLKEKDGIYDKEEISGYKYMTTKTSEDGNLVEHIYHKIQIMYVDEEGNPITEEEGNDPSKYTFVREEVDPKTGDITRIYHKVVTKFVDENGKVIQEKDGVHDKEDLDGFEFERTEKLENGDVIHHYKKKEAPKPAENKPVEPKKEIPTPKTEPKELPKTGETNTASMSLLGLGLLGAMGATTLKKKKED